MNSKCGVQSKRRCESHESGVCINVFIVISVVCIIGYTFMHLQISQSVSLILFIRVFIVISVGCITGYIFMYL